MLAALDSQLNHLTDPSLTPNTSEQILQSIGQLIDQMGWQFVGLMAGGVAALSLAAAVYIGVLCWVGARGLLFVNGFVADWEWSSAYRQACIKQVRKRIVELEGKSLSEIELNTTGSLHITHQHKNHPKTQTTTM